MTRIFTLMFFLVLCFSVYSQEYRSYTGFGNNLTNLEAGSKGSLIVRESPADFADGISIPKLEENYGRPNPRVISNKIFAQSSIIHDKLNLSDYTWAFSQMISHEIFKIETDPSQPITNIVVPSDDQNFTPGSIINMLGSEAAEGTGTSVQNPVNYANSVSAFIDGSSIYGSSEDRAAWLRTYIDGKLKTSPGNLLPWNTVDGVYNSPKDKNAPVMDGPSTLRLRMVAGDSRANENPLLLSFHTLFLREHNRLCDEISSKNPSWSDELIYQKARHINIGLFQNIIFNEWLPAMGVNLPTFSGYKPDVIADVYNVFTSAAFKLRHTLINDEIIRLDENGKEIQRGNIPLEKGFYNPLDNIFLAGGIEPYFRGMASQTQQEMDCKVVDGLRNLNIPNTEFENYDIASININRGRERGLPSFNDVRNAFGLPIMKDFYALTKNHAEADELTAVYGDIDNLDPWVGMVGEYHMPDAIMGRLMVTIIERQFQALRDGDRFYFENDENLSTDQINNILKTNLSDVVLRNTEITELQKHVFKALDLNENTEGPIPNAIDLRATVFPNPSFENATINIHSSNIQNAKFEIYDNIGRIVDVKNIVLESGLNKINFDTSNYLRGMYNVRISNGSHFNVLRLIKE